MRQQFDEKLAPNSGEDQKKSLPQFDRVFGPKLTFYQRFFCLNGQDAFRRVTLNFHRGTLNLDGAANSQWGTKTSINCK